jgi:hypothetical protein
MNLDIMRTSASRPTLLKQSTESLLKNLKFSGELRWVFHEDFLNKERSNECVDYINSLDINKVLLIDKSAVGQGASLTKLLDAVEAKYVLNWEDDYTAEREIDLDLVVKILEENNDVNQVSFWKRQTMAEKPGFKKKEVVRSGQILTTNPHWAFTPAIWRVSFIKPRWQNGPQIHWHMQPILKGGQGMRDADWIIANLGTYHLGPIGENKYSFHIGWGDHSLRCGEEQQRWK